MLANSNLRKQLMVMAMLLGCAPLAAFGQDSAEGSKIAAQNAKGPNVAARAPGVQVRSALNGPEITQSRQEAETPSRLQEVYIDVLNAFFLGLNQLIPLLPQLFLDTEGPAGIGELIISEIADDGNNTFVEIHNPSGLRIELDNWALCKLTACTSAREFEGRVMEPGDILVFQLGGQLDNEIANAVISIEVGTTADDIGLYDFTSAARDQMDPVAMVDYMQWGEFFESFGLEDVAVSSGLWIQGTNIAGDLSGSAFQLDADLITQGGSADGYIVTPFEQNSLGSLTPASLATTSAVPADQGQDQQTQ